MNILEIVGFISINVTCTLIIVYGIDKIRKAFKTISQVVGKTSELRENSQSINTSLDAKELTEYELECLARDTEFDNRILRMKEELANNVHVERHGTVAEELDPMVKNLPHNTVHTRYDIADVEVAE